MAEPPPDQTIKTVLATTLTVLWWITYPVGIVLWYIAFAIFFVAKVLYTPVAFLLQPLVYFGRFVLVCLGMPFRVAARLETLYIYLGVAAIVGLLGGLAVAGIFRFLRGILKLDTPSEPPRVRTAKEYREEKRKQKVKAEVPTLLSPRYVSPGSLSPGYVSVSDGSRRGRRNLLSTTIMEEEDSEF